MNPLDIRSSDTAVVPGSVRPSPSRRPEAAGGFDDAYNAAAGDEPSTTKKSVPPAGEGQTGSRAGKSALSWDPRMKDARNEEQGQAENRSSDILNADGDKPRLPGVHGEKPNDMTGEGDAASTSGQPDDDKKDEKTVIGAVAIVAAAPDARQAKATNAGDEQTGLRPASSWASDKAGIVAGRPAAQAAQGGNDPAGMKPQALTARVAPEGEQSGKSALASLGSKLAELAKGGDGPREEGGVQGVKSGAAIAKAGDGDALPGTETAGQGARPREEHAAAKMEPPGGLAGLRLAPALGGRNASAIAAGVVANPAWAQALSAATTPAAQQPAAGSINALRIQLHPADLGVVTATLRLNGDHLVINLKVETAAAYRQLSADNHAIVDKLKGHGYVVESVVVQHVAVDRPAAPQTPQQAGFANPQQGGQAMAGGGGQPFGRGDGRNGGGSPRSFEERTGARETVSPAGAADRGPGGLYV